jgi:Fe-S cluster assembly protein SufD
LADEVTALPTVELPAYKGRPGWQFTDLSRLNLAAYELVKEDPRLTAGAAPAGAAPEGIFKLDAATDLPAGVIVKPFEQALAENGDLVRHHLGRLISDDDVFVRLNGAGFRAGSFVYVPRGVELQQPISLITVQDGDHTLLNQRTLIVLDEGAKAEVWEQYLSGSGELDSVFNAVTELVVGDSAKLLYVNAQALSQKSWIFGAQRSQVGRDANLDWVALGFGARNGHVRTETHLVGEGGGARVTGAYAVEGSQHIDYDTTQEHAAPHTTSDLAFRGVLQDSSSAVWQGNIVVDPGAQKTDAFQESRNLLISKKAHADSIPGLEIQANDVRCTHAAAVAQVDAEQMFYLQAHGLPEPIAKRLVIEGFLDALIERFAVGPVRETLQPALEHRLQQILQR